MISVSGRCSGRPDCVRAGGSRTLLPPDTLRGRRLVCRAGPPRITSARHHPGHLCRPRHSARSATSMAGRRPRPDAESAALAPSRESVTCVLAATYPEWESRRRSVLDLPRGRRHRSLAVASGPTRFARHRAEDRHRRCRRNAGDAGQEASARVEDRGGQGLVAEHRVGLDRHRRIGERTSDESRNSRRCFFRSAYPADGRQVRAWLRDPVGSIAGLSMWSPTTTVAREIGAPPAGSDVDGSVNARAGQVVTPRRAAWRLSLSAPRPTRRSRPPRRSRARSGRGPAGPGARREVALEALEPALGGLQALNAVADVPAFGR